MVRVRDLHKIYGASPEVARRLIAEGKSLAEIREEGFVVGLSNISFEVQPGQTYIIMGLSGSGKSTLVRCLNRLVEPSAGTIEIGGQDVIKLEPRKLREMRAGTISMVFQHFGLLPHRRVLENVTLGLEVQGMPRRQREARALEVLELVGLAKWQRFYPYELSGGMQQRVSLARALATDPAVLLLDEPFSGLDPLIRRDMQDELVRLQRRLKKTIVFITHDLDEALRLGDRIAVLNQGELIEEATPHDLVLRPQTAWVKKFVQRTNTLNVLTAADVMVAAPSASACAQQRSSVVRDTTLLCDLLPIANEKGWPVAVTGENGDLLGVITREHLAERLASQSAAMAPEISDESAGHLKIAGSSTDRLITAEIGRIAK
jgi:glycine betaine/proline transport system ATP-binding protein